MTRHSPAFGATFRRVLGGRTLREASEESGFSRQALQEWCAGHIPRYDSLAECCDALRVEAGDRDFLFQSAGYRTEERREVCRLIAGLREAGFNVGEQPFLSAVLVDNILKELCRRAT